MKRVLFLAYMFPPILDAGGHRPHYFAKYLPNFGYQPTILSRKGDSRLPSDPRQLDDLPECVRIERVASDNWPEYVAGRIRWLRPIEALLLKPRGWLSAGIAWRLYRWKPELHIGLTWARPAYTLGLELIRRHRPDVILATAPPFETLTVGAELSRRTGVPFVADYRDPWTYGELWKPRSTEMANREHRSERSVVETATKIIVATPTMNRRLLEAYPSQAEKVVTITNGFDQAAGSPSSSAPRNQLVISHVGTIFPRRYPAVILEALRRLQREWPRVAEQLRFRFVGPAHLSKPLSEVIQSEGLTGTAEHIGAVSVEESRKEMREADLLFLFEPSMDYALTGKIFEYLAAKRPILAVVLPGSDAEQMLNESGSSICVRPDDLDGLVKALCSCHESWSRGELGANVNENWLAQFHRRELTAKLAAQLDEVCCGRETGVLV